MSQTPYSRDLVEEMRAYNSTLTPAGTRSRPGRGNATRGRGSRFGISPVRPLNYTSTGPTLNSTPASYGMLASHAVTAPRTWTGPVNTVTPSFGTSSSTTTNPWAVPSAVTASQTGPATTVTSGLSAANAANVNASVWVVPPAAAIEAVKSRITAVENQVTADRATGLRPFEDPDHPDNIGREPIRTNWIQNTENSAQPQIRGTNFVYPGLRPFEDPSHPDNIGKETIRTNWGSDPVGPIIEGHLKQKSAKEAIQEISVMTGIPYEQLTSDGVSIPAIRPQQQGSYSAMTSAQQHQRLAGVTNGGPYIDSFMSHRMQSGGNQQPLSPVMRSINAAVHNNSFARSFDTYVEMEGAQAHDRPRRGLGNLSDSMWNTPYSPPQLSTVTPAPIGATSSTNAGGGATGTYDPGQANLDTTAVQPPVASAASLPGWGIASTDASAQSQASQNSAPIQTSATSVAASPSVSASWAVTTSPVSATAQPVWNPASAQVVTPTTSNWNAAPPAQAQPIPNGWSTSVSRSLDFPVQQRDPNAASSPFASYSTATFQCLPHTQALASQITYSSGAVKPVKGLKDSMWA